MAGWVACLATSKVITSACTSLTACGAQPTCIQAVDDQRQRAGPQTLLAAAAGECE